MVPNSWQRHSSYHQLGVISLQTCKPYPCTWFVHWNVSKKWECMPRIDTGIRNDIICMIEDTPTPQQTFWASVENKNNLQLLVHNMVNNISEANPTIIVSYVVCDDKILPAIGPGSKEFPELLSWIEEADNRLIVHVEWPVWIKTMQKGSCNLERHWHFSITATLYSTLAVVGDGRIVAAVWHWQVKTHDSTAWHSRIMECLWARL